MEEDARIRVDGVETTWGEWLERVSPSKDCRLDIEFMLASYDDPYCPEGDDRCSRLFDVIELVHQAPVQEAGTAFYAWKRLSDGQIAQGHKAATADDLFETAGFGAVGTDKPIRGYLAVRVEEVDGVLVEASPQSGYGKPG